ncbi:unnamed protein product [Peniophora sp. CBMAI 1063]|nr:unnamed protein product [Peniophora sp. CBMAI 1063]
MIDKTPAPSPPPPSESRPPSYHTYNPAPPISRTQSYTKRKPAPPYVDPRPHHIRAANASLDTFLTTRSPMLSAIRDVRDRALSGVDGEEVRIMELERRKAVASGEGQAELGLARERRKEEEKRAREEERRREEEERVLSEKRARDVKGREVKRWRRDVPSGRDVAVEESEWEGGELGRG